MTVIDDPKPAAKPKAKRKPTQAVTVHQPQPPIPAPTTMLDLIGRAMTDPSVDVAKLSALLDIRDREENRALKMAEMEAESAFNAAMSAVQGKMLRVAADAANSSTKSAYATYGALDRVIRPLYTQGGFALSFNEDVGAVGADMVRVIGCVTHTAPHAKISHTREYHADIPADGKGAKGGDVMTKTHAHGSAFTYGKRYLLGMIFNIAIGRDDDGNAAGSTSGPISAEQLAQLEALAKEVNADIAKACKHLKIETLAELPAARFERAMASLEAKRVPL